MLLLHMKMFQWLVKKGLIKMVLILLLHVRTIVFSTNLEGPDSYFSFLFKKQYFSAKPQNDFSYFGLMCNPWLNLTKSLIIVICKFQNEQVLKTGQVISLQGWAHLIILNNYEMENITTRRKYRGYDTK